MRWLLCSRHNDEPRGRRTPVLTFDGDRESGHAIPGADLLPLEVVTMGGCTLALQAGVYDADGPGGPGFRT
ncbi:hypothetical protein GCM10017687_72390 [Streptomyces echinatus]